jgi:2,5-furandicarboxylate decarboxylase 1
VSVHDLRSFLGVVRATGELAEIRATVDPVRELGAVLKACERADKAAFFHRVRGYDVPVVGGLLSSPRRIALALGCSVPEVGDRMARATEKPLAAEVLDGPAPCQEVVIEQPDLGRWPIPTHSPLDAGPFITAGVVIARDPQTGRHNLSYNRMQVFGADRAGISMNIWRHIKGFFDRLEPQGKNLPFCVAIGPDPVVMIRAGVRRGGLPQRHAAALGRPARAGRTFPSDRPEVERSHHEGACRPRPARALRVGRRGPDRCGLERNAGEHLLLRVGREQRERLVEGLGRAVVERSGLHRPVVRGCPAGRRRRA